MTMNDMDNVPQNIAREESARQLPDINMESQEFQSQDLTPEQRRMLIGVIIAILVVFITIVISFIYLLQPTTNTAHIRDVAIIYMAVMSLLIGLVLVVLLVQLARLINLLQNEIKPILDSTNETVSNLRGTSVFLSDNISEPVIKINEYFAGFSQLLQATGLSRKSSKSRKSKVKGE